MDQFEVRSLSTAFRISDTNITVHNDKGFITISFGLPKYIGTIDGIYGVEINVPTTDLDYVEVFRKVVSIVRQSIRKSSFEAHIYSEIIQRLNDEGHIKADASLFES